mmetsp:Transcript_57608/g.122513  ORF Transcript_57608/g.122513 Transcript_57608/m.122513 type:complete len:431 (-) Transcript_57608:79-1371(-)
MEEGVKYKVRASRPSDRALHRAMCISSHLPTEALLCLLRGCGGIGRLSPALVASEDSQQRADATANREAPLELFLGVATGGELLSFLLDLLHDSLQSLGSSCSGGTGGGSGVTGGGWTFSGGSGCRGISLGLVRLLLGHLSFCSLQNVDGIDDSLCFGHLLGDSCLSLLCLVLALQVLDLLDVGSDFRRLLLDGSQRLDQSRRRLFFLGLCLLSLLLRLLLRIVLRLLLGLCLRLLLGLGLRLLRGFGLGLLDLVIRLPVQLLLRLLCLHFRLLLGLGGLCLLNCRRGSLNLWLLLLSDSTNCSLLDLFGNGGLSCILGSFILRNEGRGLFGCSSHFRGWGLLDLLHLIGLCGRIVGLFLCWGHGADLLLHLLLGNLDSLLDSLLDLGGDWLGETLHPSAGGGQGGESRSGLGRGGHDLSGKVKERKEGR